MTELTGRRRYRQAITSLILQVEETLWQAGTPGKWVCVWRDAVGSDVSASEIA